MEKVASPDDVDIDEGKDERSEDERQFRAKKKKNTRRAGEDEDEGEVDRVEWECFSWHGCGLLVISVMES